MMNPKDLQSKNAKELQKLAADLRAEIRQMRFTIATRQHRKVRSLRVAKRDLARVLTVMNAAARLSSPTTV